MKSKNILLIAALFFLVQPTAMAIEEPKYEIIDQYEDFEVRRYPPYLVAEVDVSGDFGTAGNSAFRILAGYIFGDNDSDEKMAMTAPVESRTSAKGEKMAMTAPVTSTSAANDDQTTYAFVMERQYTLESLPAPNDQRIRIRQMPERVMAVRRYSGRWTEKNYARNEEVLVAALGNAGIVGIGSPVLARYNSPFSLPILRRNEVMLEIENQD